MPIMIHNHRWPCYAGAMVAPTIVTPRDDVDADLLRAAAAGLIGEQTMSVDLALARCGCRCADGFDGWVVEDGGFLMA